MMPLDPLMAQKLHGEDEFRRVREDSFATYLLLFNVKSRLGYVKSGPTNEWAFDSGQTPGHTTDAVSHEPRCWL
jgi:hypothetical protein